jgi:uncharacterized protein (DUF488 family)
MIYTIGHSTHPIDEFIRILDAFEIKQVIDIRTIPRSRHNPQFNEEELGESLRQHEIEYARLEGLGGLRHMAKNSENTASVEELIERARDKRSVIMCAEAVPWRCHRSLIGDALLVRNIGVEDIYNETNSKPHLLTLWAMVDGNRITYPGSTSLSPDAITEEDTPQTQN